METVKGAVVGLAQLRPVEAKTTRPELYSKIGVEDPDPAQKEDAAQGPDESFVPTALTFKDEKGTVLASAILGKVKGGETPEVYVRKTGDPQSWLAEGSVEAPPEPLGWIDRQVANIPRDRIKEVTISRPDGETVIVSREKPEDRTFTVRNVPAGRELSSPSAGEPLGAALSFLAIDDVLPADQLDFAGAGVARASICTFRTFDGLLVTAETATKDGKTWLRLEATYEAPADPTEPPKADAPGPTPAETPKAPTIKPAEYVKKEADELNTKARPWVFQVPDYKAKVFATKMEELLKPLSPAPQGAVPPPAGPELPKPPGG
jgi:hypothetical protein